MRGWLGALSREREIRRHALAYRQLAELFEFFRGFFVALFDDIAADQFDKLRTAKVRIGAMDLKIASGALSHNALLLTANRKNFAKVPGLRFENWLD